MGHSHGALTEEELKNQNIFSKIGSKIKSVDGIDETATLLGQILPGLAGPIATSTVLTVAAPFVWLGILGMKEEYQEAVHEFNDIVTKETSSRDKLVQLAQSSKQYSDVINRKLGLNIKFDSQIEVKSNKLSLNRLANQIVKHQNVRNDKIIAAIGRKYGWNGALGMAGMFGGVVGATGAAVSDIVSMTTSGTVSSVASTTASIFSYIASGLFIIGQTAMSIYAGTKASQGVKELRNLNNVKHSIQDSIIVDSQIKRGVTGFLGKAASYIRSNKVKYGIATVIGQSFMFAGVVAGLTGVGLLASVPLFAIGTSLTIVPAIRRIISEGREDRFKGAGAESHKFAQKIKHQFKPLTLLEKYGVEDTGRFIKAEADIQQKFYEISDKIVMAKSLDILTRMVNDRRYRNKTPEESIEIVKSKLFTSSKRGQVFAEDLEQPIINKIQKFIVNHEEDIIRLLRQDKGVVNKYIISESRNLLKDEKISPEALLQNMVTKIKIERIEGLFHLKGRFPAKETDGLTQKVANDNTKELLKEVRKSVDETKQALKASRTILSNQLATLLDVKKMSDSISQEMYDYKLLEKRLSKKPHHHVVANNSKDHNHARHQQAASSIG